MNQQRLHRLAAPAALLVLAVVLATVLAAGLAACGPGTEETAGPHARPGTGLTRQAHRLRPPLPEALDTTQVSIARLDPDLRDALEDAVRDAAEDGVVVEVTSGWRSREHQQRLLDEAVVRYGGLDEALRYVSTPDESRHVSGDAVDIGPTEAADWLGRHGAAYGLCQVFSNEIWHFELATTPGGECPPMYADSSER